MKYSQLIENNNNLPQYLYHATYELYLKSIMKNGLGGNNLIKNWSDSKDNTVYLSTDPNIAESFAETSELADDDFIDNNDIIILQINTKFLDKNKLHLDSNISDNNDYSFEYNGIIPSNAISIL